MKATVNDVTIAESADTLEVEGYRYFPRSHVQMAALSISPRTEDDLQCPDGVQFYDVTVAGKRFERAAWSYEKPRAQANKKPVDHWVAFWGDVSVR